MDVLAKAKKDGIEFVQLQFTDLHGMIKAVTIPSGSKLEESLDEGVWFDGSSIEGFTRISESDMYLMPDPDTYAVLPWDKSTARLICDVFTPDGKPFEGDPRNILKRALKRAEDMGYSFNVGPELEFFLFRPKENGDLLPAAHDVAGYFDFSPRDLAGSVRKDIVKALQAFGMEVEMSHHEVAPGQHEIDFKYGDALTQADRCITFKHAVKSIANEAGLYATFMPKPIFGENGSGMHVHQSLFKDGKNAFYDAKSDYNLSDVAKSFIAGQLEHVKSFSAVTAPTVNSYKRLVPGYEAPVYICWANSNRSALIRIPRITKGRENSARAELRCPDPSSSPYLAFAVMLNAGLDGVERKLEPPAPVEEDLYEFNDAKRTEKGIGVLPGSLGAALLEMKSGDIVKSTLGDHTFDLYHKIKGKEWDEYRIQVSAWEHDRYFEKL